MAQNPDEDGGNIAGDPMDSKVLPLLPLRDIVVFPHMVVPLFVGRAPSIQALEHAMSNDRELLLCAQREAAEDDPSEEDIYSVGTLGSIIQLLRLPDGTVKVLVEGKKRARIARVVSSEPYFACEIEDISEVEDSATELDALVAPDSVAVNERKHVHGGKHIQHTKTSSVAGTCSRS